MRLVLAVLLLSLCGCAATKDSVCLGKPITGAKTTPSPLVPVADSDDPFTIAFDCGAAMCVIVKIDLIKLMRQNTEWHGRMTEAEKKLSEGPKCGDLTVTEPSKSFKPKPPPIKVERDS